MYIESVLIQITKSPFFLYRIPVFEKQGVDNGCAVFLIVMNLISKSSISQIFLFNEVLYPCGTPPLPMSFMRLLVKLDGHLKF